MARKLEIRYKIKEDVGMLVICSKETNLVKSFCDVQYYGLGLALQFEEFIPRMHHELKKIFSRPMRVKSILYVVDWFIQFEMYS